MGDIFDKACEELVIGQECFSNALLKRAQTESLVALELEGLVEQEAPSQSSKVPVGFIEKVEEERRMFAESPDDNEAAPIDRDVLLKAREV